MASALSTYDKTYTLAYEKAVDKLDGKVWYEPSEAERKAVVAEKRKGRDLAYAPTGTSLEAGKLMSQSEFQAMMEKRMAAGQPKPASTQLASLAAAPQPATVAERMKQGRLPASTGSIPSSTTGTIPGATGAVVASTAAPTIQTAEGKIAAVPVPEQNPMNPLAYSAPETPVSDAKKPFWKFWGKE
jgi:hypothetical protein